MGYNKVAYIVGGVVVVGIAGIVLFLSHNKHQPAGSSTNTNGNSTITTDPQTGDQIVNTPGKTPEFNNGDPTVVYGGTELLNKVNMTDGQYNLIVKTLKQYVKDHIGVAQTLKFLPDTIKQTQFSETESGTYTVDVMVVKPDAALHLTIGIIGIHSVQLQIDNPAQPGTYDSGIIDIPDSTN